MAIIQNFIGPWTGKKAVRVNKLPVRGKKKTFWAYEPDGFRKAIEAWQKELERPVVIQFRFAHS